MQATVILLLLRSHQIFSGMLKLFFYHFLVLLDVTMCTYLKTCIVLNHIC